MLYRIKLSLDTITMRDSILDLDRVYLLSSTEVLRAQSDTMDLKRLKTETSILRRESQEHLSRVDSVQQTRLLINR